MVHSHMADVAAYTGMTLSALASLPQLFRLLQEGVLGALSPITWTLSACSFGMWAAYGVMLPIFAQVPGNLVSALASGAILVAATRRGVALRPILVLAGSLTIVAGVAWIVLGAAGLGWLAYGCGGLRALPQLWRLIRGASSGGVSAATWILTGLGAVSWMIYAFLSTDRPVIASSITGTLSASAVLLATRRRRMHGLEGMPDQGEGQALVDVVPSGKGLVAGRRYRGDRPQKVR